MIPKIAPFAAILGTVIFLSIAARCNTDANSPDQESIFAMQGKDKEGNHVCPDDGKNYLLMHMGKYEMCMPYEIPNDSEQLKLH